MSYKKELKYDSLSRELVSQILSDRENGISNPYAFDDENALRRNSKLDKASLWRPTFVRDCEKILHSNYYGRYADKTQVFSFYRNDDISRRAQHVQLVSRIARNIGKALGLNIDLIEAIALGHDIGHTPFGHAGERYLSIIFHDHCGKYFQHNIHSVRVLDGIVPMNLTLQTLDGILSHNGEIELAEYKPSKLSDFTTFDELVQGCYYDTKNSLKLIPSTLEGCVVRISDIIAYLGKDRQDAFKTGRLDKKASFPEGPIGVTNAEIINNLTVNIIQNSYMKPYIKMDEEYFSDLSSAKESNYELIYLREGAIYEQTIYPMMQQIYDTLRCDLVSGKMSSPIFTHHIKQVEKSFYRKNDYLSDPPDQIVVDYIAGMTDDYFLDLYNYLFPKSDLKIEFKGYF